MKRKRWGIFSPSGNSMSLFPNRVENGVKFLEKNNIEVQFGKHAFKATGYTAGNIIERLADFHGFISNQEIDVVMASIGGYNTNQLLDCLNYKKIKESNKIICGYSDVTALLLAIYAKTGMIVFHGPTFLPEICEYPDVFDYTWNNFCLTTEKRPTSFRPPRYTVTEFVDWSFQENNRITRKRIDNHIGWKIFAKGEASGKLIGGNLTTMMNMLGSHYLPHIIFNKAILFVEECNTNMAKFDSLMHGLKLRGIFNNICGLIIGKFDKEELNTEVDEFLNTFFPEKKIPIIFNVDLGHTDPMITIPIGASANLICDDEVIFEVAKY